MDCCYTEKNCLNLNACNNQPKRDPIFECFEENLKLKTFYQLLRSAQPSSRNCKQRGEIIDRRYLNSKEKKDEEIRKQNEREILLLQCMCASMGPIREKIKQCKDKKEAYDLRDKVLKQCLCSAIEMILKMKDQKPPKSKKSTNIRIQQTRVCKQLYEGILSRAEVEEIKKCVQHQAAIAVQQCRMKVLCGKKFKGPCDCECCKRLCNNKRRSGTEQKPNGRKSDNDLRQQKDEKDPQSKRSCWKRRQKSGNDLRQQKDEKDPKSKSRREKSKPKPTISSISLANDNYGLREPQRKPRRDYRSDSSPERSASISPSPSRSGNYSKKRPSRSDNDLRQQKDEKDPKSKRSCWKRREKSKPNPTVSSSSVANNNHGSREKPRRSRRDYNTDSLPDRSASSTSRRETFAKKRRPRPFGLYGGYDQGSSSSRYRSPSRKDSSGRRAFMNSSSTDTMKSTRFRGRWFFQSKDTRPVQCFLPPKSSLKSPIRDKLYENKKQLRFHSKQIGQYDRSHRIRTYLPTNDWSSDNDSKRNFNSKKYSSRSRSPSASSSKLSLSSMSWTIKSPIVKTPYELRRHGSRSSRQRGGETTDTDQKSKKNKNIFGKICGCCQRKQDKDAKKNESNNQSSNIEKYCEEAEHIEPKESKGCLPSKKKKRFLEKCLQTSDQGLPPVVVTEKSSLRSLMSDLSLTQVYKDLLCVIRPDLMGGCEDKNKPKENINKPKIVKRAKECSDRKPSRERSKIVLCMIPPAGKVEREKRKCSCRSKSKSRKANIPCVMPFPFITMNDNYDKRAYKKKKASYQIPRRFITAPSKSCCYGCGARKTLVNYIDPDRWAKLKKKLRVPKCPKPLPKDFALETQLLMRDREADRCHKLKHQRQLEDWRNECRRRELESDPFYSPQMYMEIACEQPGTQACYICRPMNDNPPANNCVYECNCCPCNKCNNNIQDKQNAATFTVDMGIDQSTSMNITNQTRRPSEPERSSKFRTTTKAPYPSPKRKDAPNQPTMQKRERSSLVGRYSNDTRDLIEYQNRIASTANSSSPSRNRKSIDDHNSDNQLYASKNENFNRNSSPDGREAREANERNSSARYSSPDGRDNRDVSERNQSIRNSSPDARETRELSGRNQSIRNSSPDARDTREINERNQSIRNSLPDARDTREINERNQSTRNSCADDRDTREASLRNQTWMNCLPYAYADTSEFTESRNRPLYSERNQCGSSGPSHKYRETQSACLNQDRFGRNMSRPSSKERRRRGCSRCSSRSNSRRRHSHDRNYPREHEGFYNCRIVCNCEACLATEAKLNFDRDRIQSLNSCSQTSAYQNEHEMLRTQGCTCSLCNNGCCPFRTIEQHYYVCKCDEQESDEGDEDCIQTKRKPTKRPYKYPTRRYSEQSLTTESSYGRELNERHSWCCTDDFFMLCNKPDDEIKNDSESESSCSSFDSHSSPKLNVIRDNCFKRARTSHSDNQINALQKKKKCLYLWIPKGDEGSSECKADEGICTKNGSFIQVIEVKSNELPFLTRKRQKGGCDAMPKSNEAPKKKQRKHSSKFVQKQFYCFKVKREQKNQSNRNAEEFIVRACELKNKNSTAPGPVKIKISKALNNCNNDNDNNNNTNTNNIKPYSSKKQQKQY